MRAERPVDHNVLSKQSLRERIARQMVAYEAAGGVVHRAAPEKKAAPPPCRKRQGG